MQYFQKCLFSYSGLVRLAGLALSVLLMFSSALPAMARVRVVTTTTDLADFTRNIGGSLVEVESIAKGYQNAHMVDARPSYILMLRRADLFVQMGLELEVAWAPSLVENARNPKIMRGQKGFVDTSAGISVISDFAPGTTVDRSMGDVHPYGNPHYHLDPANVKIICRNITEGLKKVDPGHAAEYEAGLVAYIKKLSQASVEWAKMVAVIRGQKVVTYHNSWPYFARRFGLVVVDHVEPKAGIAPSASHIASLEREMKAQHVKLIIMEPYFAAGIPNSVARATGAKVLKLSPSVGGEAGTDSYIDLITHQLQMIVQALQG